MVQRIITFDLYLLMLFFQEQNFRNVIFFQCFLATIAGQLNPSFHNFDVYACVGVLGYTKREYWSLTKTKSILP